ncbi:uncharacterized protein ACLA_028930 [Aspergillus clavatus NRRL 1]|uniref:Uncharacterized protein n=1 Tax=Aspergillus clavatus (strain ATCC 1007 / CBS 513.65 / DSM 816 / NCTC 3887 / NRRL 1 / QM 1276 / 107) TaxID=344612 RepID=A1CR96_ASPCL|nr:uncharacterized protein ACLA_028930 [Aspergillus clavatus NRRL 1]EAW08167.1 hypothetical protein ACLA_028930 [Aspergillus clavatus NRRL 1]
MKEFVQYLPDMDLVFNIHDEPRVVVPSDDLPRLVNLAKGHVLPKSFQNQSPKNSWSSRPKDLNKGDRIDGMRKTRFNHTSVYILRKKVEQGCCSQLKIPN